MSLTEERENLVCGCALFYDYKNAIYFPCHEQIYTFTQPLKKRGKQKHKAKHVKDQFTCKCISCHNSLDTTAYEVAFCHDEKSGQTNFINFHATAKCQSIWKTPCCQKKFFSHCWTFDTHGSQENPLIAYWPVCLVCDAYMCNLCCGTKTDCKNCTSSLKKFMFFVFDEPVDIPLA